MHDGFEIYYDSLTEANWFAGLHPVFSFGLPSNHYMRIERRGENPEVVETITAYDRPDIILLRNGQPLLVIEMTQEVPTGHNVGQRFARLVRAIELGIPTIYYFPFDAKKHGEYAGICNMNARLLLAAEKIYQIHHTPLLCVNWMTDAQGEIITDGSENVRMQELMSSYVGSGFSKTCAGFTEQRKTMKQEYDRRIKIYPAYTEMPNSVSKIATTDFMKMYRIDQSKVGADFAARPLTYVYRMDMTPAKCKRQDPYTGMTFIYDYLLCRDGPDVTDKKNNLVLHFPNLPRLTWWEKNPNDPATKSCNWYLTANMLLFQDGYDFLR